jgi:alkylation response protein AidB-like acyl-CoA dehydrogenase
MPEKRWLPALASGEKVAAIAMSEPGTGSDLSGISTTATRRDDHYILKGAKTFPWETSSARKAPPSPTKFQLAAAATHWH